jgi:hypothetical protein
MTVPQSCSCIAFTLRLLELHHLITVKCSTEICQASSFTLGNSSESTISEIVNELLMKRKTQPSHDVSTALSQTDENELDNL